MQQKQTKINNGLNSVNEFLNSHEDENYSTENPLATGVFSRPIDNSDRSFDNLTNAEIKMNGQCNGPDSGVVPGEVALQADSTIAYCETQAAINLLPNEPWHVIGGQRGRPDITFFDRLQIAARFWNPKRAWGEVTQLARQYNLSRSSIYTISYRIQSLLSTPLVRAQPTTAPPPTPEISGQLFTQQDMLNLRARVILTSVFPGGVTMRPLEDILAEVPGTGRPSDTTIWRIVNQAGQQADEILGEVDYSQIDLPPVLVAVDETFFNGYPILLVVEPTSLAVCAYYVPPDCDRGAANWNVLLELLKKEQNLNIVGGLGDAAAAYPKAFKDLFEKKGGFQEDNFHLLYAIGRLSSSLERQAYAAIQKVEDLVKKLQKEETEEIVKKLKEARLLETKKIDLYDNFVEISSWVSDGLEMVDWRSGEIRDREINEWLLDVAIEEMELLEHKKIQKMSRRIKTHKKNLLTYLDWLAKYLAPLQNELHEYLNDSQLEKYLLRLTAQYWRIKHFVESEKNPVWQPLMERLNKQLQSDILFDEYLSGWVTKVHKLLEWAQRTSSAVENVNGILKPMIKRKKRFSNSQNMEYFIALFALWHNLRVFKEGKRKGKSPFEILGIDLGEKDWKTLLGYKPVE